MTRLEALAASLKQLGETQDSLKARSMLYQAALKAECAEAIGAPFAAVDKPYATWERIRTHYLKYRDLRRSNKRLAAVYLDAAKREAAR